MPDVSGDTLDRLLADELPAEEQRRLALAALDDPDLFDSLTASGAVVTALRARRGSPRPVHAAALAVLASAAAVLLAVVYWSRSPAAPPGSATTVRNTTAEAPPPLTALVEPPILLTAQLDAAAPSGTFRTEGAPRREPKAQGAVTSVTDQAVELDVGSLDGVSQGATFDVVRGTSSDSLVGRVAVTTVFRERARGHYVGGGRAAVGDRVVLDPGAQAAALLEAITARLASGDTAAARRLADRAAERAQAAGVSPDLRARIMNERGAIQIADRDYAEAARSLETAQGLGSPTTNVRVTNNLGALAALRGDRAAAERYYHLARSLADASLTTAERAAIDKNIDVLARSR